MMGKDHTIFAVADGMVKFDKSATRARICIVPVAEEAEDAPPAPETRKTRKYAKCVTRGAPARKRCGSCRLGGAAQRADAQPRFSRSASPGSRRATAPTPRPRWRAERAAPVLICSFAPLDNALVHTRARTP
jgi:hypothetical protein